MSYSDDNVTSFDYFDWDYFENGDAVVIAKFTYLDEGTSFMLLRMWPLSACFDNLGKG